jgi:hypothetical protein
MLVLDILPVVSAIITIAGLSFKAGQIIQKLNYVIDDVTKIKAELKDLDKRITVLESTTLKIPEK